MNYIEASLPVTSLSIRLVNSLDAFVDIKQLSPQGDMWTINETALEEVDKLIDLGTWVDEPKKKTEVRIAKGWGILLTGWKKFGNQR